MSASLKRLAGQVNPYLLTKWSGGGGGPLVNSWSGRRVAAFDRIVADARVRGGDSILLDEAANWARAERHTAWHEYHLADSAQRAMALTAHVIRALAVRDGDGPALRRLLDGRRAPGGTSFELRARVSHELFGPRLTPGAAVRSAEMLLEHSGRARSRRTILDAVGQTIRPLDPATPGLPGLHHKRASASMLDAWQVDLQARTSALRAALDGEAALGVDRRGLDEAAFELGRIGRAVGDVETGAAARQRLGEVTGVQEASALRAPDFPSAADVWSARVRVERIAEATGGTGWRASHQADLVEELRALEDEHARVESLLSWLPSDALTPDHGALARMTVPAGESLDRWIVRWREAEGRVRMLKNNVGTAHQGVQDVLIAARSVSSGARAERIDAALAEIDDLRAHWSGSVPEELARVRAWSTSDHGRRMSEIARSDEFTAEIEAVIVAAELGQLYVARSPAIQQVRSVIRFFGPSGAK